MVFVAGKHITNINEFSADFHVVIQLISDGYNWLKWALDDPSLSVYYAQSETDLLEKIQSGLHETPVLKSNTFNLHLDKIFSFQDSDMVTLASVFANESNVTTFSKSLAMRYGLVSNAQLQSLNNFIQTYDLSSLPIFQGMNFREQLELFRFKSGLKKSKLNSEAIRFAASKASTLSEFVHYAGFYQNCAAKQLASNVNSTLRYEQVNDMYESLSQLCFSLLYVPNIGSFDSDDDMAAHLKDFVLTSKLIGYRHKATAMENLAKNIQISGADETTLKSNIEAFMGSVKNKVNGAVFSLKNVPQDGWLRTFSLVNQGFEVVINVDSNGDVFLSPETGETKN